MRRTALGSVLTLGLVGGVLAWLMQLALTAAGRPVFVPPVLLALALVTAAVIVVTLAWRIHRALRTKLTARVDPAYAIRVVGLAKACSASGALFSGAGIGLVVFLLTRSVLAMGLLWPTLLGLGAALILLGGGLLAERFCSLPPEGEAEASEKGAAA